MALIKCTHCGKEINNQRDNCIHCGKEIPVKLRSKEDNVVNKESLLKETSLPLKMKNKTGNLFKTFIVLVVSFLLLMYMAEGEIIEASRDIIGESGPFLIIFGMPILISIIYYRNNKEQAEEQAEEQSKTLSEKYSVLKTYKALAFLLMIVSTGFYIYSLVKFFDLDESYRQNNIIIGTTVSFIITIFSLFCLTKIIDFLYDLDKK
jgi:DNA-directed RNA polymerase subunit RPC12/RpoP|tara:strand:- start:23 stop:640 length:618 start_codon:yes stop_codon:yes gene_type:complete